MAYLVKAADRKKTHVSRYDMNKICKKIRSEMPEIHITGTEIIKNNKFLHAAFQLRRAQHQLTYGCCPKEDLYHATAEENVNSILETNLDWRRVQRSRFGVGVSFSKSPEYANRFCNDNNGNERAFIVCEVLTGNKLNVGCKYSRYPRQNIDTYRSNSNMVVVKFEDDSFYPKCVVYYQEQEPRSESYYSSSNYDSDYTDSDY